MVKKVMIEALERLYNKTEIVEEQGFPLGMPPTTQSKPAKEIEEQVPGGPAIPLPAPKPSKPVGLAIGEEEVEEREDPSSEADKARAKKEYGNVKFADQPNKKYPVDLKHVQAAISYFSMPKNYKKYSSSERKIIARNIAAAAEKFGKDVSGFRKKFGI